MLRPLRMDVVPVLNGCFGIADCLLDTCKGIEDPERYYVDEALPALRDWHHCKQSWCLRALGVLMTVLYAVRQRIVMLPLHIEGRVVSNTCKGREESERFYVMRPCPLG